MIRLYEAHPETSFNENVVAQDPAAEQAWLKNGRQIFGAIRQLIKEKSFPPDSTFSSDVKKSNRD